jgi:putative RecB family exonuclease
MPGNYSYSKISQFEKCPRQYKFSHIEKVSVEKPVGVEMFLGSTVHRILEKLYKFKVNGRIQPEDEMLKYYYDSWEGSDKERIKVTREHMGIDDYINVGADALKRYYKKYYPFNEGEILGLEKNISFPLDEYDQFHIRAKLDKITKKDDNTIEIIDYKTDSSLPTQQSLDNNLQMALYQIGVRYLWPQFENVTLKQIYLRQGVEMAAIMSNEKIDELCFNARQRLLEIEQAVARDDFPPRESALCDYCVYYELCPAKRHRLAMESESEEPFDAESAGKMADRYLKLYRNKKEIESELKILKDEILKFCETVDISRLDSERGHIKITIKELEEFPTRTADNKAYAEISFLAREAKLDECFKLEPNVLYSLYAGGRLPENLTEKLRSFLQKKLKKTATPYLKKVDDDQ